MDQETLHGSCACGAVQWETKGAPLFCVYCHCSFCRADHGVDMNHQAGFLATAVKFTKGEDNVIKFQYPGEKSPVRCSCKTCGSKVHNIIMGGNGYGFPVACFCSGPAIAGQGKVVPEVLKATLHVNYASRLTDVSDSLPKFLDFPAPFGGSGALHQEPDLKGLCQTLYGAFGKGDIQTILDACSEQIVWTGSGVPGTPLNDSFRGKEGVLAFFGHVGTHCKWTSFVPQRFLQDGNTVVVLGTAKGSVFHHPEATWNFTHILVFGPDKKLVEMQDQWRASTADAEKIYGNKKH